MILENESTADVAGKGLFVDSEALKELVCVAVEAVLREQQALHVGVGPYERGEGRVGHRNGTKPRTMKTRVGKLEFEVPQVRGTEEPFRPTVFERYQRSEKALLVTLQEMYVKGVSTRDVGELLEEMSGFTVSAQAVSQAAAQLDESIKRWRERRLEGVAYPYVVIDAIYEKVRRGGCVVSQAVMIVAGISEDGRREILGLYTGPTESETTWSDVFKDLLSRGLSGVELLISDAHRGIIAAAKKHLQGVAWQRCRVHFMREMMGKTSWRDHKELAADLKSIYASAEVEQCLSVAEEVASKWEEPRQVNGKKRAGNEKLAAAIRAGAESTLTVCAMDLPPEHQRRLHSTNMLERLNREMRRRTRKVSIFPNEASLIRLYGAMLMETDEAWKTERSRYLNMDLRRN